MTEIESDKDISYLYLSDKIKRSIEDFKGREEKLMYLTFQFEKKGDDVLCNLVLASYKDEDE